MSRSSNTPILQGLKLQGEHDLCIFQGIHRIWERKKAGRVNTVERKEVQRSLWAHELNKKGADLSRKHLDQQVGGGGAEKTWTPNKRTSTSRRRCHSGIRGCRQDLPKGRDAEEVRNGTENRMVTYGHQESWFVVLVRFLNSGDNPCPSLSLNFPI